MLITQQAGTVPAGTTLPLWEDTFKSQVDPNKKTIYDDFKSNLGAMGGRTTSGKTWTALGVGGALWTVYNGYAAQSSSSSSSRILLPHAKSGKACQLVEWNEGYIGLLIRAADANNYHQIAINSSGLYYTKYVSSVTTILATKGLTMTAGKTYVVGVEWTETNVKIYIDDVLAADVNDTDLSNNINIGFATSSHLNKVSELAAR